MGMTVSFLYSTVLHGGSVLDHLTSYVFWWGRDRALYSICRKLCRVFPVPHYSKCFLSLM